MELCYLADRPELAGTVARMLNDEFGTPKTALFYRELVDHTLRRDGVPTTAVALEGDTVLGTVGIWKTDLLSWQDVGPWLACLLVDKAHRSRGIGAALQAFAVDHCRRQGFRELYLYTTLVNYYERTGWTYVGRGYEHDGSEQRVYRRELPAR